MHELAARLARGEEAAFAELYDSYADRLHHWLSVRLGSRDAAADVVQSAFLRAVKSRRRFRGVENPAAYLFQIARNAAARAARRNVTQALPAVEFFGAGEVPGQQDDAEVMAAALGRLEAGLRQLFQKLG